MTRSHPALAPLALACVLGLGACAVPADGGGPTPIRPGARWALAVEPQLDRIALAVHDTGVSANQRAALAELVRRYAAEGTGDVLIETPSGDDPVSGAMAWAVRDVLAGLGVPSERVRIVAYAAPDPRAPVLAGFSRLQAVIPDCSTNWGSITHSASNQPASNLGCAVNANMAAQIADPRDILGQRATDPADAGRRTLVLERYRAGEPTASVPTDADAGQVAGAVE